jgi:hypothetical protein
MLEKFLIEDNHIEKLTQKGNFAEAAKKLLEKQKSSWEKLSIGYISLLNIKIKFIEFDQYTFKVQFNPGRFLSSSAKVDEKSISERECFLCYYNLPPEQKGILYDEKFLILCNPHPIFPEHFTIAYKEHIPQRMKETFNDLLLLSKDLSGSYTVVYNGPKCGASAPDHLHFQAGSKFFMPIDTEFEQIRNKYGEILSDKKNLIAAGIDDGLRRFISFESNDLLLLNEAFKIFYDAYETINPDDDEPLLNILSFYSETDGWRVLIFLRAKHRSTHYFSEGKDRILLSLAAVDLGGVCITPFEKDFNKMEKQLLTEIFQEVMLGEEKFEKLKSLLREFISSQNPTSILPLPEFV